MDLENNNLENENIDNNLENNNAESNIENNEITIIMKIVKTIRKKEIDFIEAIDDIITIEKIKTEIL